MKLALAVVSLFISITIIFVVGSITNFKDTVILCEVFLFIGGLFIYGISDRLQ